ncbi:MAG TPA: SPW repeat protein [Candidatus Binatia bacterium]
MKSLSWINFILGLWLIVAPFALNFRTDTTAMWNSVVIGIVVAVLSIIRALGHTDLQALRQHQATR